jgi:hypothetical protein
MDGDQPAAMVGVWEDEVALRLTDRDGVPVLAFYRLLPAK